MTAYKILIKRQDGQVLSVETRLMGDHAAIRRAHTLTAIGEQVEVWRGGICIFESLVEAAVA